MKYSTQLRNDATILVAGEGLRRGVMAVAGIIAFRVLPLSEMGILSVAVAVTSALRFVCAGGVPFVIRRDMVLEAKDSCSIWNSGLFLVIASSVACIVLSPAVILALRAKGLLIVFMLVLFHHSLGAVTDAFNALLIARSRMKACTIVDVVIALALLIFTVISWLVGWKSALPYALAYAIAGILGTLLAYTNIRHYFRFEMPDQKHLENMLRQSLPFAIDAIVITAYFRLSVAGVYWLDSDASSALYATGQSFAFLIGMVPGRIALAALPRLVISAKKSAEALKQSVDRLWLYFIPMGAVIVGGAVLTCSWWLPLILGAKGKGAVIHCILIGLSRLPVFISTPATFALDAMMLQKLRVWISLFAGVLLAILGIPLTSHYGGVGMSIALLIVETIGAAAYVIMYLIKIQEWKPVQNDPGTGGKDLESISEKSCLLNEP